MQQQIQQQMQQMQRSKSGGAAGAARKPRSDRVYLVANDRSNSVIVHAPPNKLAIIAAFIARMDVRNENAADFERLKTRTAVFRLASLSPEEVVETLNAMDALETTTRLQVDSNQNAIIAYASVADQYIIRSIIDRLDGSARELQVITLRRLDAASVAGSIKSLMGVEEKKKSTRTYYDPWSYGYGYGGGSSRNQNSDRDKMQIAANVQDNQLLLWVNDIEFEEIQDFLVKLGEIPAKDEAPRTLRVIDASKQPETYEYLKRLKEQWDRVSPNPLVLPDKSEFAAPRTEFADASGETISEEEA